MQNFEKLYKMVMNESDAVGLEELESVESELGPEDPSEANPRNQKVKNILALNPKLNEMDAEKIVDADLYDIFVQNYGGTSDESDLIDDEMGEEIPEMPMGDEITGDDMEDIPAYDADRRQAQAELEEDEV